MKQRQRGVALVTAILMVSLATVAAVAMATRQQLDIRRTGNLLHGTQAYAYTEAAESWARVVLERDFKQQKSQVDTLEEDWARQVPISMVEGGSIRGRLVDMQGLFNVNSLIDAEGNKNAQALEQFQALLRILDLNDEIAYYLLDFIDENDEVNFPAGAEDNEYMLLQPGYRCANRPLASISELRLVKGFTREVMAKLTPFVSALPEPTPINVNTAPVEVLRSLANNLSTSDAEALIEDRGDKGYEKPEDFLGHPVLQGAQPAVNAAAISVNSQWFQMLAVSDIGQARVELSSLIQRVQGAPSVIARERILRGRLQKQDAN